MKTSKLLVIGVCLSVLWCWSIDASLSRAQRPIEHPRTPAEVSAAQQAQRDDLRRRIQRARTLLHDVGLTDERPPEDAPTVVDVLEEHKTRVERRVGRTASSPSSDLSAAEASVTLPTAFESSQGAIRPRDPFATTLVMHEQAKRLGTGPVFVASNGTQRVPRLTLRGYVEGADGDPIALLQVGNSEVYVVRAGDTISLYQGQGQNTVLKVKQIGKLSALVEVGTLGQVIVVR